MYEYYQPPKKNNTLGVTWKQPRQLGTPASPPGRSGTVEFTHGTNGFGLVLETHPMESMVLEPQIFQLVRGMVRAPGLWSFSIYRVVQPELIPIQKGILSTAQVMLNMPEMEPKLKKPEHVEPWVIFRVQQAGEAFPFPFPQIWPSHSYTVPYKTSCKKLHDEDFDAVRTYMYVWETTPRHWVYGLKLCCPSFYIQIAGISASNGYWYLHSKGLIGIDPSPLFEGVPEVYLCRCLVFWDYFSYGCCFFWRVLFEYWLHPWKPNMKPQIIANYFRLFVGCKISKFGRWNIWYPCFWCWEATENFVPLPVAGFQQITVAGRTATRAMLPRCLDGELCSGADDTGDVFTDEPLEIMHYTLW